MNKMKEKKLNKKKIKGIYIKLKIISEKTIIRSRESSKRT